jgi:predicted AAA+ superfamily ATPase
LGGACRVALHRNSFKYDFTTVIFSNIIDLIAVFFITNSLMPNIARPRYVNHLNTWLTSPDRRPLLIRGARQVGKTSLVRDWVPKGYKLLELNFEERPDARSIFTKNLDVVRIVEELELFWGTEIRPESTVLFFDEAQVAPEAISSLRFFYEKYPQLPVVAAGSLLEFALKEISFPVGRIESIFLRPVSFEEFVRFCGSSLLAEHLGRVTLEAPRLSETAHDQLLSLALRYFKVGGMPKAVASYAEHRSLERVAEIHRLLVNGYRDDFPKYGQRTNIDVLNQVYSKLPFTAGGSRAKFTAFSRDFRAQQIKSAIELLTDAHIITKVYAARGDVYPVDAGIDIDKYKLAHLDIGLLQHAMGFDWSLMPHEAAISNLADGRLAEQFVAQELLASKSIQTKAKLTYWERVKAGSEAEVDFLVDYQGGVLPIEVKSGSRGTLRSLHQYVAAYSPRFSIVLSANTLSQDQDIFYLPLYAIGQIVPRG